ncbi:MAG: PaaI family thioesterase [Proteobacteria bacterium]|nr:PaaI family thioesterase [Pseudomonadota bacterium]
MNAIPERLSHEQIQARFDTSPFIATLGLVVLSMDYEASELTVKMPLNPGLERAAGTKQFHGGPIASFIDTVGDFAIGMLLGGGVPTINIRIDYLKPAVGDALVAVARVRRTGRTVTVVDIDVLNEQESLVAIGRGTYATLVG